MPLPTGTISYSDVYNYYGGYAQGGSNVDFEFNYGNSSQNYVRQLAGWGNRSAGTICTMASLQGKAMIASDGGADPFASNRPPTIWGYITHGVGNDVYNAAVGSAWGQGGGNGTYSAIYQPYASWTFDWWRDSNNYYYSGRARDGWFTPYYDINGSQSGAYWRGGGFQAGYAQTYFTVGFPYGQNGSQTYNSTGYTYLK